MDATRTSDTAEASAAPPAATAPPQPAARATLADIAREALVSPATVSLVLRNRPGVGDSTRRRVLAVAQELGYAPQRRNGRPAPGARARQVALLIKSRPDDPPERNEFYSHVLMGIEAVCREQRVHLLWGSVLVDEQNRPLEMPPLLEDDVADGLLVVGTRVEASLWQSFRRLGVPIVLVDSYLAPGVTAAQCDSVVTDNARGGADAAAHLLALGHRHIALLGTGEGAYPSLRERGAGFGAAVAAHYARTAEAGSGEMVQLVETGPLRSEEEAEAALRHLLADVPALTACFAANDALAVGALLAAGRARRRVPQEFSLVGFDDILRAEHLIPPLTTLRVDKLQLGRLAAHLLLERLARPGGAAVTATVGPELIVRSSCAPRPLP
jgi:LacI family transcriptional regulator